MNYLSLISEWDTVEGTHAVRTHAVLLYPNHLPMTLKPKNHVIEYHKVPCAKFEQFGIIRFWVKLQTNNETDSNILDIPTKRATLRVILIVVVSISILVKNSYEIMTSLFVVLAVLHRRRTVLNIGRVLKILQRRGVGTKSPEAGKITRNVQ